MAIINMMEQFVDERVRDLLKSNANVSEEVLDDIIKAMALNTLPAKYVSTKNGEIFVRAKTLMNQYAVDIDIAVIKAMSNVLDNPNKNRS